MKRRAPLKRTAFKPKAPPARPAKQIDYTPRPRLFVRPATPPTALPMAAPLPKDAPVRDRAYRRLVAALPCIHCGRPGRSQAAHGPAMGKGIKASDADLFPLCADEPGEIGCHTKFDRYVLFPREQRREVAARWAAETALALGRDADRIRSVV